MKNKLLIGGLAVILVGVIAFVGLYHNKGQDNALGGYVVTSSPWTYYFGDVVGTHKTTSTVGVVFTGGATSTYVSVIGTGVDQASYLAKITSISTSTGSHFITFAVEGSNDTYCDITTTTVLHEVNAQHINWFDASNHISNIAHATSFDNASSTKFFAWDNPIVGAGKEILLEKLNFRCLRLNVSGNSSTVWVGLATKDNR